MKTTCKKWICSLLCLALLLGMAGCQKTPLQRNQIDALFATLLAEVNFSTELADAGEDSALYFPTLPQGSSISLHIGSGYYADEAALITLASPQDAKAARAAVDEHIAQKRHQFLNYIPEEVSKIDNAVIWQQDCWLIVCITADVVTAKHVLENAGDPSYTVPPQTESTTVPTATLPPETTTAPTTEPTTAPTTEPTTEPTTTPPTVPPTEPALYSQSGKIHHYPGTYGVIRVDDMAYEVFGYVEDAAANYASVINQAAELLGEGIQVYDLLIPTAIGIVMPDDIAATMKSYVNQGEVIERMYAMMSDDVIKVNCYNNLRLHRDEYLYFRTDYHWNGPAAYYAYESFCQAKGITPYTMDERPHYEFSNFLGALYFLNTDKDPVLAENADTIHAYDTKCNVSMYYIDRDGNTVNWPVIVDVSGWAAGSKYNCFAGSDQPLTVFTNHDLNDGSACIVIKESFGNAIMSYIADHYNTVYEIDYRYWNGSLVEFAKSHGVTDVIFANNLTMTGNNSQIGMIKSIF